MEEEKLVFDKMKRFNFRFSIGWNNGEGYEINLAKAYKLLQEDNLVKYEPESTCSMMSVWNEKMKINLLNSGFCRGFSKTEDEKEILCFLQSIKEKILLARIKR